MTQRAVMPSPRLSGELPAEKSHGPISEQQRDRMPHPASAPLGGRWRIHDRTHLELPLEYQVPGGKGMTTFEWDAYFFAPRSFRLDRLNYDRESLLAGFRSYVRHSAPRRTLLELGGTPLDDLAEVLRDGDADDATRQLRLFACGVRRAVISEQRRMNLLLAGRPQPMAQAATQLIEACDRLTNRLHELVKRAAVSPGSLATAVRWVREDISLMLEMLLSVLGRRAASHPAASEVHQLLVKAAIKQSLYRRSSGLTSLPTGELNRREVEHLEFRRHTLKRFSSSVLWLKHQAQEPGRLIKQLLYALAAGVAMTFAVTAALLNGANVTREQLPLWLLVAIVAYAVKDRMKASLQSLFKKLLHRKIPDRRWLIKDEAAAVNVARMDEQTRFVNFEELPEQVLHARRLTRQHPIEEVARPETVLWHHKSVTIDAGALDKARAPSDALLEIFRVDLTRWLTHTDDPKQRLLFADPDANAITSVVAPRVYNIAIVFRMRKAGEAASSWHRVRVVVSRKGLRRIEPIC